ncbi:hypothetical protein DICPUDRAFT_80007 [Dictyostelium purpureum]|uniref:Uncharacterized protein n=1 Tax=Dictyostelium purpureum TaxID=5786 RepID=F0ZP94_DICPU|nr:uncharacterized protein DICPUDRAFT_80007 [Dictyostelium purpureum]EGC34236.1 hypothetical protein DICPUDRAFT_80007 [Dictyostelium purpureum]|eukprot:XP_003289246.1 hypothetical protein DICPUDRAFT_80007 [Dictyostelium purpureum]
MILIDTIIFKNGYQFWFDTLSTEYDPRLENTLTQDELFKIVTEINDIIKKNNKWVVACLALTFILVVTSVPLIIKGLLFWWLLLVLFGILFLSIQWFFQFQFKSENTSPEGLTIILNEEYKNRSITFTWKKIVYSKFGGSFFLCITHPKVSIGNESSSSKIQYYFSNKHLLNNNENEKILNDITSSSKYGNDEESNEEGIPLLASKSILNYKDLTV